MEGGNEPALKEAKAVTELAQLLYSFLPGSPHPYADKALLFPGVATLDSDRRSVPPHSTNELALRRQASMLSLIGEKFRRQLARFS